MGSFPGPDPLPCTHAPFLHPLQAVPAPLRSGQMREGSFALSAACTGGGAGAEASGSGRFPPEDILSPLKGLSSLSW